MTLYVVVLEEWVEYWEAIGVAHTLSAAERMADKALPHGRSWEGEWYDDTANTVARRRDIEGGGWMNIIEFEADDA